ncbi:MAG TPA: N-acetylmuramoyl-L-alanine amidase [Vicinamibacterales bacterium]|nr:N-acetylmuramoyl-L-alanine amidase [Vicinamibacterales bacterium]
MALWSPNSKPRPAGVKPQVIVLHSTGGSFTSAVNWLMNKVAKVSAHYVVSRTGEVRKLVPLSSVAYHAGKAEWNGHADVNGISASIEMAHVDFAQDWPDAQVKAVAALIEQIRAAYGPLPVTGHYFVARPRGRKVDPALFPWHKIGQPVVR